MVYTVTLNPAIDYVLKADKAGDIYRAKRAECVYGGKGINVSVVLNRLGVDSTALGFVAGFTGDELVRLLDKEGIKTDFVTLEKGNTRINVKILANEEIFVNAPGPDVSDKEMLALFEKLDVLKADDFIVLSGSVPNNMPQDIYEKLVETVTQKGVKCAVDTSGEKLKNVLRYKPFLIKPNHHELGELFGQEILPDDVTKIEERALTLQKMGAQNVLVSRGECGATLVDENGKIYHTPAIKGKLVNSTGCGDSMLAGFVAGYIKTGDFETALKLGSAAGSATAFSCHLATKEEIEKTGF